MTAVKGSKQYKVKVVTYNPWLRSATIAGVLSILLVSIAVGFSVGEENGERDQAEIEADRDRLLVVAAQAQGDVARLRQEVANLSLGSEVDQRASEDVRAQIIELKAQVAAQNEDIGFYRGLMSPTGNKRGLTIGSLDLFDAIGEQQFSYKLVVQQLATRHTTLTGAAGFNVVGQQDGQTVTYTLNDLADNIKYDRIKLKFKYFQTIDGRLQLPVGFHPEYVEVMVESSGKNAVKVDKKFGWFVQES